MEIFLLMLENASFTDNLKSISLTCYIISIVFLSLTIIIYLLNLKRLQLQENRRNHPMEFSGTLLRLFSMVTVIGWQMFVAVLISGKISNHKTTSTILLALIIYTSMVFYLLHIGLLLRLLRMTVYCFEVRTNTTIRPIYCLVVIIPLIILVIIVTEAYFYNSKSWPKTLFSRVYIKWILVSIEVFAWCFNFVIVIIIGYLRIASLKSINIQNKEIAVRLSRTKPIRNNILMFIWLSVIVPLNILSISDISYGEIVSLIVFHSLLGPLYFVIWFVIHDKKFKTPFRWQQQREVRQRYQGNKIAEVSI